MSAGRWEYKVVFVDGWHRTSIEGDETYPERGERTSGFGRRFLNGLGADGWELVGIQHTRPGQAYYIFKRPLAEGAEPDLSVVRNAVVREPPVGDQPSASSGPQVAAL
jgi:hypothetical protein